MVNSTMNLELGVLRCENSFNDAYFKLHKAMFEEAPIVNSRNGTTREILDFKTILDKPYNRCVGGNKRNINIYFLLAEALWIWIGGKDVKFLDTFNSSLKQFSDDGEVYHAPYGFRLRSYGKSSMNNLAHTEYGIDQIHQAIYLLSRNHEDRRVVMSIWNPSLDLGAVSKDLPCNDMVMLKIRNNKLNLTIQNRSNDLNLGLTTNIFQFSFIGNMMAEILGVGIGTQVHNSNSLHIYTDATFGTFANELNENMKQNDGFIGDPIYDNFNGVNINCEFNETLEPKDRLEMVDFYVSTIINNLELKNVSFENEIINKLPEDFKFIYYLLALYVVYKNKKLNKIQSIYHLLTSEAYSKHRNTDFYVLAVNFFVARCNEEENIQVQKMLSDYSTISIQQYAGVL